MKRIRREFVKYVAMNVSGMMGLSIYILADTYFIANRLGADGLAALNLALPAYNLVNGLGLMLGIGGAARFIIVRMEGSRIKSHQIFTTAAATGVILGIALAGLGAFYSEAFTGLLGAKGHVLAMTDIYLKMIWIFSPTFILNNILSAFVKNDGNPGLAMVAMLAGSLFNIFFDYIFMFPLRMGMLGAVLATGFSPVSSMIVLSAHFRGKVSGFGVQFHRFHFSYLGQILAGGIPSLVMELTSGLVMIILNLLILGLAGSDGVAAYGVMANLLIIVIAVYNGIAQGVQPLFGAMYGRGDRAGLSAVHRYSVVTVGLTSGFFYLLTWGIPGYLVGLFNREGNLAMQQMAVSGFPLFFGQCFFLGMNILWMMYFVSVDRSGIARRMSVLKGFALPIPLAFCLSHALGLKGIWSVLTVTELMVFVMGGIAKRNASHKVQSLE